MQVRATIPEHRTETGMKTIRVVLADDHPLIRAGLRAVLIAKDDIDLVGEAADGHEASRLCLRHRPDVMLLDLSMPGPAPAETAAYLHLQCPETRIVVLTAYNNDMYIRGTLQAGAVGYILKDEAPEVVVNAIRAVMRGDLWFSRKVLEKLSRSQDDRTVQIGNAQLTEREAEILEMIAQGCDSAEIAQLLSLAQQTVRNHLHNIYGKLNVRGRGEAIIWAREQGLVGPDPRARSRHGV